MSFVVLKKYKNIISENAVFRLVRLRGLNFGRPASAMWLDSNAIEMTTAEHYMFLTKFCELPACQCYSSEELKFILEAYTFV